jgi:DNA-binding transcriptional LysR family regulator
MDTRFLESFITVVEHGSIAEAARRLNLTPAAVAQRIRALEHEIGAQLLSRSGRTVKPTEAGANILDRSRRFLQEVRDLRALANDQTHAGELRLGAVATALNGLLPDILASLAKKYPQLGVYVVPGTSDSLYPQVVSGDLDAAIIVEPEFTMPKTCGWRVLRQEPLVVLTPASARVRDPHRALQSAPFIRYDRNAVGGRIADSYLRSVGIRPQDRFELTSLTAIALLVDRGLGVSLVPDWAPPWPEGLSLKKLPIPDQSYMRRMGLLWTRASVRIRLVNAFLGEAVGLANEQG